MYYFKIERLAAETMVELRDKGRMNHSEVNNMIRSLNAPVPENIEPYDLFTSYLFEKANEEAENELA